MPSDTIQEIVVLSGKGGTGKTSVTASLAVIAGNAAVVADCDVDAANMHLLLQPDFGQTVEFYSGQLAELDQEQCTRCGICADICRFNAIPFHEERYRISSIDCEGCGYCARVCPTGAITMKERRSGDLYISRIKSGSTMVHARLDIAAENSGKLVAKVKNDAKAIAKSETKQYIIVDGSPGIGCPVVSSLAGASYVLLVTEPTVSALHDLKRVYAVIKRFRIPAGCLINKYDLNKDKSSEIRQFLKEEKIDHLADIPFDPIFSSAMIEQKTIVEVSLPLKHLMEEIWDRVNERLNTKKQTI